MTARTLGMVYRYLPNLPTHLRRHNITTMAKVGWREHNLMKVREGFP
jgi:hypothetical protein